MFLSRLVLEIIIGIGTDSPQSLASRHKETNSSVESETKSPVGIGSFTSREAAIDPTGVSEGAEGMRLAKNN